MERLNNYYGLPCLESQTGKSIMYTPRIKGIEMEGTPPYKHKDLLRLGFYLYMGTYFKNL